MFGDMYNSKDLEDMVDQYRMITKRERFESSINNIIESKVVTINTIRELARDLGPSTTLEQILNEAQKQYPYVCPKCTGSGEVEEAYYPCPKDDWPSYHMVTCDLCEGRGFTKKKIVPKMVKDGWKIEE